MQSQVPVGLTELILSSSAPTAPLPTTHLHSLATASLLLAFKSPAAAGSTATSAAEPPSESSAYRQTLVHLPPHAGQSGLILGLGGKDGRATLSTWGFHKEQYIQRVVPPVRLTVLAASSAGTYLAGGTPDGRVLLWDLASGALLAALDAHYRAVSVLEFSADEACLVSGSEDAGVSVWSLGALLSPAPPTPYATLTDHTLPLSSISLGTGVFPSFRLFTASLDSTVKLWDLSSSPPALLTTFSFPSPVTHLAVDPLERFFFVATADQVVRRVDLFELPGTAVGGGGAGDVISVSDTPGTTYSPNNPITALYLSTLSPTLLLASQSTIHVLSLPSLLPTRLIPPPVSSTPPGPITHLSTLLRPPMDGTNVREVLANGLGRTVENEKGWNVRMRIGRAPDARVLLGILTGSTTRFSVTDSGARVAVGGGRERERELEDEVEKLKAQLEKAVDVNERMWRSVVQSTASGSTGTSSAR